MLVEDATTVREAKIGGGGRITSNYIEFRDTSSLFDCLFIDFFNFS